MSATAPYSRFAKEFSVRWLSHMSEFQYLRDQLIERYSSGSGRHRHETVVRHARRSIGLQKIGLPRFIQYQIHPPPPLAPEYSVSQHRLFADCRLQRGWHATRAEIACFVRYIFSVIVVETA